MNKIPNNPALWLKNKAGEDPGYLEKLFDPGMYNKLLLHHQAEIPEFNTARGKQEYLAVLFWKDFKILSEHKNVDIRAAAYKVLDYINYLWETEKKSGKPS